MGLVHVFERGGDDYRDYKSALKKLKEAKKAIDIICELTEDMESEYGERGARMRGGYRHDEWDDDERKGYSRVR